MSNPSVSSGAGPGPAERGIDLALEAILQKLKLLEFGLYGLQQLGRRASTDLEDLGPFYRLAEEISTDVMTLRERFLPTRPDEPAP